MYNASKPVYRNAWPNALSATVLDSKSAFAAVVGQTHTVTNPGDGTIQLLLHRRANIKGLSSAVVLDDASTHRELIQVGGSGGTTMPTGVCVGGACWSSLPLPCFVSFKFRSPTCNAFHPPQLANLMQFTLGSHTQVTATRNRLALMREAGALYFASTADASFDHFK